MMSPVDYTILRTVIAMWITVIVFALAQEVVWWLDPTICDGTQHPAQRCENE